MSAEPAPAVLVRAPAKINLALSVGPLREDGYHDLFTVFHAVSVMDELVARRADRVLLTVEGERSEGVPAGEDNLALRAARLLGSHAGISEGVHLQLRKAIPVAGGLAGGSADAAAALVACDALWGLHLPRAELLELAGELGSDVPFGLLGGTALGAGRGERLTPALVSGSFHWVLAVSREGLSTPAVYRELDRLRSASGSDAGYVAGPRAAEAVLAALRAGDCTALGRALVNDLEAAACSLRPRLRQLLDAGADLGALGGIVSGSGPTCAFLVRDAPHGVDLAARLMGTGLCDAALQATGPAPGPRPQMITFT